MDEVCTRALENYPYPIASRLKLSCAIDRRVEPEKKLDSILHTAEEIAKFVGTIAVLELVRYREEGGREEFPRGIKNSFDYHISRPSFGKWVELGREGFRFLEKVEAGVVVEDLKQVYHTPQGKATAFQEAVNELVSMRNHFGHKVNKAQITARKFARVSEIAFDLLQKMIAGIDFFSDISFGFIETIELKKERRREPRYLYKGKRLKGKDFTKEATRLLNNSAYQHYKETEAIVIRFEEKERYLNLVPFYIFDEDFGNASDVFVYNGCENGSFEYSGCLYGGKLVLEEESDDADGDPGDWKAVLEGDNLRGEEDFGGSLPSLVRKEMDYIVDIISN